MTTDLFASRARVVALAAGIAIAAAGGSALAQGEESTTTNASLDQITSLNGEARSAFEAYSFKKALARLQRGLALARQGNLLKNPAVAETYMLLGVAYISGSNDLYRGLHYFVRAIRLDPKITLPKALATPQLAQLFKTAQRTVKAVGSPPTVRLGREVRTAGASAKQGTDDQQGGRGLIHSPIDTAKRSYPIPVKATTGLDIKAHRVFLHYRPAGTVKFFSIPMKKTGEVFRAAIPPAATQGRYIHYYIEALDQRGRLAGSMGSARSPNVIIIN